MNIVGFPIVKYIVRQGDNLNSVAHKFNITPALIKSINNLPTNVLNVGQEIIIPLTKEKLILPLKHNAVLYVVKAGDSLWEIAKRFDVSVSRLRQINNLATTNLSVGQELIIPISEQTGGQLKTTVYVSKPGDTVASIARRFNLTVDELKKDNALEDDIVPVGIFLTIPMTNVNRTANINYYLDDDLYY